MMKQLAFVSFTVLALASSALAQGVPTLKAEVLVSEPIVRVGDLIEFAGKSANTPVFRAPDIGHTGTVQVSRIIEAVKALGLENLETNGRVEVSVTRDARVIPLAELQDIIAQRAAQKLGLANPLQVQITSDAGSQPIRMDASRKGEVVLTSFNFDTVSNRYEATFNIAGSVRPLNHKLYGSAVEVISVLVPARPINKGEVLKAADLTLETLPRNAFGGIARDALADLKAAIGQAARRQLAQGRPMRASDLMKPEVIDKNSPVMISYQVPGLSLSVRGKALEAGAEGDTISVLNLQSNKPMSVTVIGPGRVKLTGFSSAAYGAAPTN